MALWVTIHPPLQRLLWKVGSQRDRGSTKGRRKPKASASAGGWKETENMARAALFWWSIELFSFLDDESRQAAPLESEMKNKYLKIGIMLYVLFKVTNDLCWGYLDCCCLIDLLTLPSTLTLELSVVCLLVFYLLVCFGAVFRVHF